LHIQQQQQQQQQSLVLCIYSSLEMILLVIPVLV